MQIYCLFVQFLHWSIGGPEFCGDNVSHVSSEIQFTLCGFPTPKVLWSYDTKQTYTTLNANANKDKAYVNFFALAVNSNVCVHFLAIGDKGKTLSWKKKLDLACKFLHLHFLILLTLSECDCNGNYRRRSAVKTLCI